jgi:hypothetical protein
VRFLVLTHSAYGIAGPVGRQTIEPVVTVAEVVGETATDTYSN